MITRRLLFGFLLSAPIAVAAARAVASETDRAVTVDYAASPLNLREMHDVARGQSIYLSIQGSGSVSVEDMVEQITKQFADGGKARASR